MITIDVTSILSQDLKSRSGANDLLLYVRNCDEQEVVIDFRHVKFATRSFIDEFYNLFIKPSSAVPCHIEIINVPEDIQAIFAAVSNTQTKVKTIRPSSRVRRFQNVEELLNYMDSVAF